MTPSHRCSEGCHDCKVNWAKLLCNQGNNSGFKTTILFVYFNHMQSVYSGDKQVVSLMADNCSYHGGEQVKRTVVIGD